MFDIEDEGEESDGHPGDLPCRQYHKSVDLSNLNIQQHDFQQQDRLKVPV